MMTIFPNFLVLRLLMQWGVLPMDGPHGKTKTEKLLQKFIDGNSFFSSLHHDNVVGVGEGGW